MVTGFLRGLFGSKPKDETPAQPEVKPPKPAKAKGQAYYLDADDAQTYGNVEYMRTAKKTRRTFPKTVNNQEMEFEQEVSSMNPDDRKLGTQTPKLSIGSIAAPTTATSSKGSTSSSTTSSSSTGASDRRKADSSLDMFRNMAKDIRK